MMAGKKRYAFLFFAFLFLICSQASAQDSAQEEQTVVIENSEIAGKVTLDFNEADIRNVLKIVSYKSGVNIITTPEVIGNVTIRLVDVPWDKALDAILKTYGFGYERQGNIITVAPIEKLTNLKKQEVELAQVQPTVTEVFNLKYIDAQDAKKALEPLLSGRGRITILEMTGQAGWEFGAQETGKRQRSSEEKMSRSKVLIVSDIPPALDKMREVIEKIDTMPQQVLIETKLVEVSRDKLKDIGFDWGTGTGGAETSAITVSDSGTDQQVGGHILGSEVKPSGFSPKAGTNISGVEPYNLGLEVLFKRITGTQFEAILHALEEDVHTNTLSAPKIMALSNQEAAIIINTQYPILKQEQSGTGDDIITTTSLDYYQDIGIQLNVVPQVSANNYINMVIHPAITSYTDTLGTTTSYPIIQNREAETRILMKDGETVVIGGLIKDVKTKSASGVPLLSKVPLIGKFFRRDTSDTEKVELLIFISARIIRDGDYTAGQIKAMEEALLMNSLDAPPEKKN
jgi:type IV pilus assembly protein PilQ